MRIEINLRNELILKSKRKCSIESEEIHIGKRKKIRTYIEINSRKVTLLDIEDKQLLYR